MTSLDETSKRIRFKYPDRVPVILTSLEKRTKYIVPQDITLLEFLVSAGQQAEEAVVWSDTGDDIPKKFTLIQIYQEHRATDGFLYLKIENRRTCEPCVIA